MKQNLSLIKLVPDDLREQIQVPDTLFLNYSYVPTGI
jgi:hypothetical protein